MRHVWQTWTVKPSVVNNESQTFFAKPYSGNLGGGTICGYVGKDFTIDPITLKSTLVSPVPIYWSKTAGSDNLTEASTSDYRYCALTTGPTDRVAYTGNPAANKFWTGGYTSSGAGQESRLGLRLSTGDGFVERTVVGVKGEALGYKTGEGRGDYPDDGPSGDLWTTYLGADDVNPRSVEYSPAAPIPGERFTVSLEPEEPVYGGKIFYQYYYSQDGGRFIPAGEKTQETSKEFLFPQLAKSYQVAVTVSDDMGYSSTEFVEGKLLTYTKLKIYLGVEGRAVNVKKIYVGVNGSAREIKAAYVGIGGKARKIF